MKTIVIKEVEGMEAQNAYVFDLTQAAVKNCIGCWTCWWKTPGKCAFRDLEEFYSEYITADKAIYIAKVKMGFVSADLKTLFDRMLPLYLPYIEYSTGESMHLPRYDNYPDVEFYYDGEFETKEGHKVFEDYINRVFYQFHTKNITIKPVSEISSVEGNIT